MVDDKEFEEMMKMTTGFVGCSVLCHNCERVFFSPIKGDINTFLTDLGYNGCPYCSQTKSKDNKLLEPIKWYTQKEMDLFEMAQQGLIKFVDFDGKSF